jgi:hypothetical protein
MTNDTTSITRLLTRKSQERNGDLLGHYIGCKKPQRNQEKLSCVRLEEVDKVCQIIYFRLKQVYSKNIQCIILIFVCNSKGNLPSSP